MKSMFEKFALLTDSFLISNTKYCWECRCNYFSDNFTFFIAEELQYVEFADLKRKNESSNWKSAQTGS